MRVIYDLVYYNPVPDDSNRACFEKNLCLYSPNLLEKSVQELFKIIHLSPTRGRNSTYTKNLYSAIGL